MLDRRTFLGASLTGGAAFALGPSITPARNRTFTVEETTVTELSALMQSGRLTSRALTAKYLARIRALDEGAPRLGTVIQVNPDALRIAEAMDREGRPRGPLHGIPVLLKDNIETADAMATTAGSLALLDAPRPGWDAGVARRLREAGAVIHPCCGGGLSPPHGARGTVRGTPRGPLLLRPRVERAPAAEAGLCLRTGHPPPAASALPSLRGRRRMEIAIVASSYIHRK